MEYIKIVCLNEGCKKIFKRNIKNKTLRYYQKDHSIKDNKGNIQNCPKCGGIKLKFKDYL